MPGRMRLGSAGIAASPLPGTGVAGVSWGGMSETVPEDEEQAGGIPGWQDEMMRAEAEQAPCERMGPF